MCVDCGGLDDVNDVVVFDLFVFSNGSMMIMCYGKVLQSRCTNVLQYIDGLCGRNIHLICELRNSISSLIQRDNYSLLMKFQKYYSCLLKIIIQLYTFT